MRKRVLIIANGFVNDAPHALPAEVLKFADPDCEMHVVVPPHVSRLQSLCSDVDASRVVRATIRVPSLSQDREDGPLGALNGSFWCQAPSAAPLTPDQCRASPASRRLADRGVTDPSCLSRREQPRGQSGAPFANR